MNIEINWEIRTNTGVERIGNNVKNFSEVLESYGLDTPKLNKQPRIIKNEDGSAKCVTACRARNDKGLSKIIMVIHMSKKDIEDGNKTAELLKKQFDSIFI